MHTRKYTIYNYLYYEQNKSYKNQHPFARVNLKLDGLRSESLIISQMFYKMNPRPNIIMITIKMFFVSGTAIFG